MSEDVAVDDATLRALRVDLSVERHTQVRLVRELAASATAAAGQVRDVRLDELEHPQVAVDTSIVFDLVLDLAMGPLASALTRRIIDRISSRVILGRLVKGAHLTEATADAVKVPTAAVLDNLAHATPALRSVLADEKQRLAWWTELAQGLSGVLSARGKTALAEAAKTDPQQPAEAAPGQRRMTVGPDGVSRATVPPVEDSPATAIELAVLRSCAIQEQAIGVVFDSHQRDLDDPRLTIEQAVHLRKLLDDLGKTASVAGADATRLKLFFEACIWRLAFSNIAKRSEITRRVGGPRSEEWTENVMRLQVSTSLLSYWVRRLPHPQGDGLKTFAEWAVDSPENQADMPWRDRDGRPFESEVLVPHQAHVALVDYFAEFGDRMEPVVQRLGRTVPKIYAGQRSTYLDRMQRSFPFLPTRPQPSGQPTPSP